MSIRVMKAVSGNIAARRAARVKRIIAAIRQNPPGTQPNIEAAELALNVLVFIGETRSFLWHN